MPFYSPLRYPGGKNKLANFIALICKRNNIKGHYVEPYAGGASVALFLLLNGYVKEITINDFDRSIYAFWYSILNDTEKFCRTIKRTKINIENWKKYKKIQKNKTKTSLFKLGFSTFFLNRTNMSGIINGGVIGGVNQTGKYKMDCRFNKQKLISRIKKIAENKDKINIYNLDAIELVKNMQKESRNKQTIFYFDPPYYVKGSSLYANHYQHDNHYEVSEMIKKIKNSRWIVSYDNVLEIKFLYREFKKIEYSLRYTAHKPKIGREILFFDKNLSIPNVNNPIKV